MLLKYLKESSLHGDIKWLKRFSRGVVYWLLHKTFLSFWHHSPPSTVRLQWDTTDWFCPESMKIFTGFRRKVWKKAPLSLTPECPHALSDLPHSKMKTKYGSNLSYLACLPDLSFFPTTSCQTAYTPPRLTPKGSIPRTPPKYLRALVYITT